MASVFPEQSAHVTIQPTHSTANPFKAMNKEWQTGLFSCCDDMSQCCYAYFCACCFMGSLAESIGESKWSCLCVPYALAMYRMKVRTALQIRGDTCSDHCTVAFCGFCAGLQMRNELKYYGLS